jgi:hypothetical protein
MRIMKKETVGSAMEPSCHPLGVQDIIPDLYFQVQRYCDIVYGKPFMFIFRRPRRKWQRLALPTLKGLKAQLEDQEMKSDIEWIAKWKKPDDANLSMYREYSTARLPSIMCPRQTDSANAEPLRSLLPRVSSSGQPDTDGSEMDDMWRRYPRPRGEDRSDSRTTGTWRVRVEVKSC